VKSDGNQLHQFWLRLCETDAFWSYQSLPCKKFIQQKKHIDFMYDTGVMHAMCEMTQCSPQELFEKMVFFPARESILLSDDEYGEAAAYPYVKAFKGRKNFIDMLDRYLEGGVEQIGVITVNRYDFEDGDAIKVSGVFRHDRSILHTFTPKRFTNKNWIHGWPWPNFGTAFFTSPDLSWALYSTSTDDDSLVVFMADKSFTKGFFAFWPDVVKYIFLENTKSKR